MRTQFILEKPRFFCNHQLKFYKLIVENLIFFSQCVRRDYMIFTGLRFAGETAYYFTRSKVQARLQFLKICKKYQALYKQHHYSPSTILTSESLAIETVSNTSQIPACLYGPENLRRSHSNPKVGALKQPKLLYLFKCIFNSFWSTKLLYGPRRTIEYQWSVYISTDLISKYLRFIYKVIL